MKKITFLLICFNVLLGFSSITAGSDTYPAKCVTVTGTHTTEGVTKKFARKMAIRDALKNASMQSNLKISSSQKVSNFSLVKDATRFTTQSKVSKFRVANEGLKELSFDDMFDKEGMPIKGIKSTTYQVTLDVCLTEDPSVCGNVLGNHLQPKAVVAQVLLTNSYAARDITNLRSGYQVALKKQLSIKGYNNLELLHSGTHLQDEEQVLSPNLSKEVLDPIRNDTGAQYLILNVIRSVSRHNESSNIWNSVKRFYNHDVKPNSRYLEVEGFVVDLVTRQVVYQKIHGIKLKGSVTVGRDRAFGTNSFFATNTGKAFTSLLEQSSSDVYQYLKCKTLKSSIIDIRGEDYILHLSAESGARVGDELSVYHNFGRSIMRGGVNLGFDSKPAGFLEITRIHSKFAIAKVVSKDGLIQVGDEVQTW